MYRTPNSSEKRSSTRRRKPLPQNSALNSGRPTASFRQPQGTNVNNIRKQQRKAALEEQYNLTLQEIERLFAALQNGQQQNQTAEDFNRLQQDYEAAKNEILYLRETLNQRTSPVNDEEMKRRLVFERERYAKLSQEVDPNKLPAIAPEQRREQVIEAYQEFRRTGDWDLVRQHFPELWELHIRFKTWEDAKGSIPREIAQSKERSRVIYLRVPGSGSFVRTSTFYDTGNRLGPLISLRKLQEFGHGLRPDESKKVKFMGATGTISLTRGSITLEKAGDATYPESKRITFHVWDDPVGLGDVLFGANEDSGFNAGDNGVPVLLPIKPVKNEPKG